MKRVNLNLELNISIDECRLEEFLTVIQDLLSPSSPTKVLTFGDLTLMGASIHDATVHSQPSPSEVQMDMYGTGFVYQLTGCGQPLQDMEDKLVGDHWPQDER